MSEKRRNSKNRILRTGESQEADRRYKFRYIDANGKRKSVYSWRLVATDSIPAGKRDNAPLLEQEKVINRDLDDNIIPDGGGLTVLQLTKKYIATKTGVKHTTRAGYGTVINFLEKDRFGNKRIDKVKLSDAKAWMIKLQKDDRGYSTIHSVRSVVRPAFQMAVDDDLLVKNPFEFQLATVVVNDSVTREAITRKQERQFLEFVKNDKHFCKYYEGIFILFKTGMRISEFVGLTISDLDMKNRKIIIDHQLQRARGMPMVALHWEKYFQHIRGKYNSIYKIQMPKVTPHVCRHTFCSNMAKSGMNPKTLQYIMGHSDIGVTSNSKQIMLNYAKLHGKSIK